MTDKSKRLLKYLVIFIIVSYVSYNLPKNENIYTNHILVGMTAAILFSFMDMYSPCVTIKNKNKNK